MRIPAAILALLLASSLACAETVVLKSGEKIEGDITEKNNEYVKMTVNGAVVAYHIFEIETIGGKPVKAVEDPNKDRSLGFLLESKGLKRVPTANVVTIEDYLNRGFSYYTKDNLDKAIANFNKAIELNPQIAEAYLYRGLTYTKRNELDKAIEDYNKAIEISPKNEEAYYVRGLAYAGKRDAERALSDYSKAIALNPKYVQAYLNRSIIYLSKGDFEKVFSDIDKVMGVNAGVPAAYYIRGMAHANENDAQKAIADYDEAIRLNPGYAEVYASRAMVYAYKDKIERSKIDQNSPAAYINIGIDKLNQADYNQAVSDCSKAIELAPKYAEAYATRAKIYILGNDYDKAWADIHKVEELGSKVNPELLEGLKKASGREK
jgi:tetratricopeptide (TPR) repeat protein